MQNVLKHLQPASCWCYPHSHLEAFYLKSGLVELNPTTTPSNISSPWQHYKNSGQTFLLMGSNPDFYLGTFNPINKKL